MEPNVVRRDTRAWIAQVWIAFALSLGMTVVGIAGLPGDDWVKGYMLMGVLFSVGSAFSLSKTLRDNHEADYFHNRVKEARTTRLLTEFEKE